MANPAAPAAAYAAMHTRVGYADGAPLTTALLDALAAFTLAQDGDGNVQSLRLIRIGASGTLCIDTAGAVFLAQNAFTNDGTVWYPYDSSQPSYAVAVKSTITMLYSSALGGAGAITWQTNATWGSSGSVELLALAEQVAEIAAVLSDARAARDAADADAVATAADRTAAAASAAAAAASLQELNMFNGPKTFTDVAGSPFALTATWMLVCTTTPDLRGLRISAVEGYTALDIEWTSVTAGDPAPTESKAELLGGGDDFGSGFPLGDIYLKSVTGQTAVVKIGA